MELQENKPLSAFSTFGIGGQARYFTTIHSARELAKALKWANDEGVPILIIGRGSNSLFDDRGFSGLAIHNKINFCTFENESVHVGSGFNFSILGAKTARRNLSGLEFASGIPGSVGGAIFMNAGANGGETADHLESVTVMSFCGTLEEKKRSDLQFGYRYSSLQKTKEVIVSARFVLKPDREARKRQLDIVDYRTRTQPYGDKSCGCIFRNPEEGSAGALIEKCGLKGKRIGGAEISLVHGNFIVNRDGAKAEEILSLGREVQRQVFEKTGILLEWELRRVPYDPNLSS